MPPPKSITSWFTSKGLGKTLDEVTVAIPHDIYVFGTQENSLGDKEWVDFLRAVLKDFTEVEYRPVRTRGSWGPRDADTGGWWRWVMLGVPLAPGEAVAAPALPTPGVLGWSRGAGVLVIVGIVGEQPLVGDAGVKEGASATVRT